MKIKWKFGAVCYANKMQRFYNEDMSVIEKYAHTYEDFQLNEIRQGDYIETTEIYTKQKYDDAVEVFELFWVGFSPCSVSAYSNLGNDGSLVCCDDGLWQTCSNRFGKRKITYPQLMAIGKLKRAMIERDNKTVCGKPKVEFVEAIDRVNELEQIRTLNKSEQAYSILKSLDYEYDLNKQKWHRKEWV